MILARLEPNLSAERRAVPRRRLKLDIAGSTRSKSDIEVIVHDLSVTGLLMEAAVDLHTGDQLVVDIPGAGPADAVVMWASGNYFGCEFTQPIPKVALSAAALRSAPQPRPSSPAPSPLKPETFSQAPGEFGPALFGRASQYERADVADALSPRRKLLILLGLSLGSWAVISLVVWQVLALVWG